MLSKLLQESSICPLNFIYKIVGVSTPLVLCMGLCTHTHKAMHDQRKLPRKHVISLKPSD